MAGSSKGECKHCENYSHISSECWVNINKNDNRNLNKTARNTHFNGECNNCGKRASRYIDCCTKKVKYKDNDVDNLFMGATLCGEFREENNVEYIE